MSINVVLYAITPKMVNDLNCRGLSKMGYVGFATVLARIPVSKPLWCKGVTEGEIPEAHEKVWPPYRGVGCE